MSQCDRFLESPWSQCPPSCELKAHEVRRKEYAVRRTVPLYFLGLLMFLAARTLGDSPAPSSQPEIEVSFQQGIDGYLGTVDTEIWALATKTILNANPNASSDANNDGGESQVLMRFDGIIGPGEGQIPKGSTIVSAKLIVSAFDQGTTVNLHRMLVPFGRAATWDSMISGVSADGLEASRHKDGFTFGKIAASSSGAIFDVTDTVQLWVNGRPNYGWVFLNTGGNGWDFYASEFEKVNQRPKLVVRFLPDQSTAPKFLSHDPVASVGQNPEQ